MRLALLGASFSMDGVILTDQLQLCSVPPALGEMQYKRVARIAEILAKVDKSLGTKTRSADTGRVMLRENASAIVYMTLVQFSI
jgi:hypothetical protein